MGRGKKPPAAGMSERDFVEKAYSAAAEWTRFADPKAAGVLVVLGLGLNDLLKRGHKLWNALEGEGAWGTVACVAFVCALVLAAATVWFACQVFFPRTKKQGTERSLLFFGEIAAQGSAKRYREALRMRSERDYLDDLADQTYEVAHIAAVKHGHARSSYRAVIVFLVAWAIARVAYGFATGA